MASGHVNRAKQAEHMAAPTNAAGRTVKIGSKRQLVERDMQDRKRSPPKVSRKWEYYRRRLETFGKFSL
jgi:hypothetical protein